MSWKEVKMVTSKIWGLEYDIETILVGFYYNKIVFLTMPKTLLEWFRLIIVTNLILIN